MSVNSLYKKLIHKKTKTFWVGTFCLSVLVYLCLVARVHIQQFKSTYIHQVQQQLLQQAQAQGKHFENAVELLQLKLQSYVEQKTDLQQAEDSFAYCKEYFSVLPEGLYLIDHEGRIQNLLPSDQSDDFEQLKELAKDVTNPHFSEKYDRYMLFDGSTRSLYLLSAVQDRGYAVMSLGLSELMASINQTASFSAYGICMVDAAGQLICLKENELSHLIENEFIRNENIACRRLFSKIQQRQQGIGKLSRKAMHSADGTLPFSEEILVGYTALNMFNQAYSIIIISDDSIIASAIQAHVQGIMVAMVCLFAVLLIVCVVYYKSEKRRLLLEQQSELGQTTKELHEVADEKRRIVAKLQNKLHFYRQILDALPIGLYWRNREGILKNQNTAFRRIFNSDENRESFEAFVHKQDQIDQEVLTKGIELLNIPETIETEGQQQFLVSRIPISSNDSGSEGMISCYLPQKLFENLVDDRPCGMKDFCLTQGLSLPISFVDSTFTVRQANQAFYELFRNDSEPAGAFNLSGCLGEDVNLPVIEEIKKFIADKQRKIREFQIKYNKKNYRIFAECSFSQNNPGAVLLWVDPSREIESTQTIEFELYRYRSEINEQDVKIRKYEECLPERIERLFRDKVKRAEEILAMKDEDPMSTIQTQQLIESVQKSINCNQEQRSGQQIEFILSEQLPQSIYSEWHKLYQSLVILGETLSGHAPGQVRYCIQNTSEADWIESEQKGIVFSVEYSGQLILEEWLPQILDVEMPLTQWYNQCSQRDQAINLRVVARLLSKIHYQLLASHNNGQSRFWFVLPEHEQAVSSPGSLNGDSIDTPDQRASSEDTQVPELDIPHILIVDDVEENCTLMQVLLAKDGHRSTVCQSGEQAVETCRQERFDLILMDIQMPGMNGLDATRQIRTAGMNVSTPIIAMTASDEQDDELAALDCGCDDYLTKPIKRKLMERKIWRSLEKTRQIKDAESGKDIISFLDGNGDYQKAIESFVENLPQRMEEMKLAFQQHDMKDLAFKVHALKGLGGFAGFSVYTEKARKMEESIKANELDKVQTQLEEMIRMCMRTRLKTDC